MRIWHPYTVWEEVPAGMWGPAKRDCLDDAVTFTGNATLYGAAMMRVTLEWPRSCEHNLTDIGQNRRAWIGHAAACLEIGCPEHVTRKAWGFLTQVQRDEANDQATQAILSWERKRLGGQFAMFLR